MKQYLDLMQKVLNEGQRKTDRTGTGTLSIFGHQMRFDLSEGFPLITTKKVHFKGVVAELIWFLSGSTKVQDLRDMGCTIWDEWEQPDGTIGPMYGKQWRKWDDISGIYHNQIENIIESIRKDPHSRRHIVSSWNVSDLYIMALAPCHVLFQFYVADGKLSCQLYQRSADIFLGLPFNIASYALLTHMIAQQCDLDVGEFIWTGGDCHLYLNHLEQAKEQLIRAPYPLPVLLLERATSIDDYTPGNVNIQGYSHHPAIKAPVAI